MKVNYEQLSRALQNKLSAFYLVSGDEHLFVHDACDQIRQKALSLGYGDRKVFHVEGANFDWQLIFSEMQGMSLFADKSLIEIRLNHSKLGDKGSKALQQILKMGNDDNVVILSCPKLTSQQQNGAWFKAWLKETVIIQIWPPSPQQIKLWMKKQFHQHGMQIDEDAINLLHNRVEGNLLAAAQEIEKLYLNFGSGLIGTEQIYESVLDSARYTIFDLVDTILQGDSQRGIHILSHLQAEGVEPILIIWAIARELRTLAHLHIYVQNAYDLDLAMKKHGVWQKRKPLIKKAMQTISLKQVYTLQQLVARIDQAIKGLRPHAMLWHELTLLCVTISGSQLPLNNLEHNAENL